MKNVVSLFLFFPSACLATSAASFSLTQNSNNPIVPQESVYKITNPFTMFNPNDTYQFIAAYESNNSNEDKTIWESSNPDVGTIDENGNFKAIAEGKTIITATLDSPLKPTDQIEISVSSQYRKLVFNNMQTKGMTVDCHDMMDNNGFPFYITFVSSQYKRYGSSISRPVHNQVKMSDIEILFNGELINSQCSLSANRLMIPAQYTTDTLTINYLGAEIADWINWSDIVAISDDDTKDNQREIIKDYFSIGDYKKLYSQGVFYSRARIVDFYHDNYLVNEEGVDVEKPIPTTWELYEKSFKAIWGCQKSWLVDYYRYKVYPWNSEKVTVIRRICNGCKFDGLQPRESIKYSEGNEELKSYDNFFVGSYAEYCGEALDRNNVRETYKGIDGTIYAYYDTNAFISTVSNQDRRKKSDCSEEKSYYFTRLPWKPNEQGETYQRGDRLVLIDGSTGEFFYDSYDFVDKKDSVRVYLMFGI